MNNVKKNIVVMYLVLSLIFIVPLSFPSVNAAAANPVSVQKCQGATGFSFNIKDSLILSILTLCLPGVINRLHEHREIQCEAVTCYYDAIINNVDPAYCLVLKDYNNCVEGILSFKDLFILQFFDHIREVVDSILKDPMMFIYSIGIEVLRCYETSACCSGVSNAADPSMFCKPFQSGGGKPACVGFGIPVALNDIVATVDEIASIAEAGAEYFGFSDGSACDNLDDIRDEVEQILEG